MFTILIFTFACSNSPLPELRLPSTTLLLRESLQGPGPERTGNWWGRFDPEGCWWEAHNTWLVVTDPDLLESSSWFLHWNAQEQRHPWFCLTPEQLSSLHEATQLVEGGGSSIGYSGPVDRWSVQTPNGVVSHVIPRGANGEGWEPVLSLFDRFSTEGVWGQSPEAHFVDGRNLQYP